MTTVPAELSLSRHRTGMIPWRCPTAPPIPVPPPDTTLTIVSPENIGFQFRLAGMAARSLAFLLDGPLIGLIAFGMVVGAGVFGLASESPTVPRPGDRRRSCHCGHLSAGHDERKDCSRSHSARCG